MSTPNATPPGWYADPNIPGHQRWWDGQQWTEHVGAPAAPLVAPAGTKTDTVWIWLIVLLPLLSIGSLFLLDIGDYMRQIIANPSSPNALLSLYTSPGYLIVMLSSFVLYVLTVIFAAVDMRTLTARNVPKPFHWAWSFFGSLVYTIGRSVVVHRRTGAGLRPLWGMIAVYVLSIIVTIIWTALLIQQIAAIIPTLPTTIH